MKTTDDLVKIASVGGGMVIDTSKTTEDLIKIAGVVSRKGGRIVIRHADRKTTDDLIRITAVGKSAVTFDFTD